MHQNFVFSSKHGREEVVKHHKLLELYLEQLNCAGKNYKVKALELTKFLNYCSEIHGGLVDYAAAQGWLKIREKTLNPTGTAKVQNHIAVFTDWARLLDSTIGKVPKAGTVRVNRRKPVILKDTQVNKIVRAQRDCVSNRNVNPKTLPTITGLLFATGMRISEAINLKPSFVDWKNQSIYVPCGKSPIDRVIPISMSTKEILYDYAQWRDSFRPDSSHFFVYDKIDVQVPYQIYRKNFNKVVAALGYRLPATGPRKRQTLRIHDLRHSFAVNSLIKIYDSGADVNEAIVQLSSIMGHKSLKETYWYIEAVPELIAAAFKGELS